MVGEEVSRPEQPKNKRNIPKRAPAKKKLRLFIALPPFQCVYKKNYSLKQLFKKLEEYTKITPVNIRYEKDLFLQRKVKRQRKT